MAVIGAGIVGLTAALKLSREGVRVTLLEARSIGSGATGYTTGKLSSLNGLVYKRSSTSFGEDTARAYGEANEAGLEAISDYVEQYGIDCDFRRKANYTYSESDQGGANLAQEVDVATRDRPEGEPCRRGERASLSDRRSGPIHRPGRVPRAQVPVRSRRRCDGGGLCDSRADSRGGYRTGRSMSDRDRDGGDRSCRSRDRGHPSADPRPGPVLSLAPILSAPTPFSSAFATRCRRACI